MLLPMRNSWNGTRERIPPPVSAPPRICQPFVSFDGGIHIGPVDLDVALRLELGADRYRPIAFQFHADAHDALLVSKQSLGFFPDERLERRGQFKVDAGDDQFVLVLAVHVCPCGFG